MKFILPFILSFALITQLYGQNINVSGKVVSSMDDEPLIGVNVTIKGSTTGTTTDLEGNYTLTKIFSSFTPIVILVHGTQWH